MDKMHVEPSPDLAIHAALGYRAVAHITIPTDIQVMEDGHRSRRNLPHHTSDVRVRTARLPDKSDLRAAASQLNAGQRVAIVAGQGALGAADELERVADLLAAPIVKPLLGKGAVPYDSPYTTGSIGLLGTVPPQQAMEECDMLLMVSTSFPYMEFLPRPGQAKGVQIDADPMRIGLRYPVEVGLVGDSKAILQALIPLLRRNPNRSFLEKAQQHLGVLVTPASHSGRCLLSRFMPIETTNHANRLIPRIWMRSGVRWPSSHSRNVAMLKAKVHTSTSRLQRLG